MVKSTLALLFVSAGLFVALVYFANYHPAEREPVAVHCTDSAPQVERGKPLKVMTWNIQYMAGKNYVFFYDRLDGSGPDNRPSSKDIAMTLDEVVRVVRDEQPDVVLFQEVDEGAKRTNYANQTQLLLDRLGSLYPCSAEVFYWRSKFVPHPRVMGSVGLKLVTLSRFEIQSAVRHRLAQVPMDVLSRQFYFKRAVLEVRLPITGGGTLSLMNTHLDAFAQGHDTMRRQAASVYSLLDDKDRSKDAALIAGDFNLLPPGKSYERLPVPERAYFVPHSELEKLYTRFQAVPTLENVNGTHFQKWVTHFPNNVNAPDRTVDYVFATSVIKMGKARVRQADTTKISDHFPLLVEITVQ